MPDTTTPAATPPPAKGLFGRIVGVIVTPRATYADVAARPRWFGALAVVLLITIAGATILLSTEVGQRALLDQQVRTMESFGVKVTDAVYQRLESRVAAAPYFTGVFQLVTLPLMAALISAISLGIFNALLGGDASFKQVFAVVVHSGAIIALQQFFVLPLDYMRETLASPTTLAVFVPMLDESSFMAHLLGAVDLFIVWWAVNLAIGLGVLYRKRTAPIAATLIIVYVLIGLAIASVKSALGA